MRRLEVRAISAISLFLLVMTVSTVFATEEEIWFYKEYGVSETTDEKQEITYFISPKHLESLPSYDPAKDNIPLTLDNAIRIAYQKLKDQGEEPDEWLVVSINMTRAISNPKLTSGRLWYYVVSLVVDPKYHKQFRKKEVFVLLDGTVVLPQIVPGWSRRTFGERVKEKAAAGSSVQTGSGPDGVAPPHAVRSHEPEDAKRQGN